MTSQGREEIRNYVLGTGFDKSKSAIDKLSMQAIEPSTLATMATNNIFYYDQIMT